MGPPNPNVNRSKSLNAHVDHAGQGIAELGVVSTRKDLGPGDREVRHVGRPAEQRVGDFDAVELPLDLSPATAAEMELAALSDDAGLGAHGFLEVVDRDLLQLLGGNRLLRRRRLRVDALLGAHFDLLHLLHDLLLAEVEIHGRGGAGVDLRGLDLLVVPHRLSLYLDRTDRHAGNHVIAVLVGQRALMGAEHDHICERHGNIAALGHFPGDAPEG